MMSRLVSHSKHKVGCNHLLVQCTPKAICQSTGEKKRACQSGIKRILSPYVSWQSCFEITFRVAVQKLYEITHESVCTDNDLLLLHSTAPIQGHHGCFSISIDFFHVTLPLSPQLPARPLSRHPYTWSSSVPNTLSTPSATSYS